jgi:hypothetical protein
VCDWRIRFLGHQALQISRRYLGGMRLRTQFPCVNCKRESGNSRAEHHLRAREVESLPVCTEHVNSGTFKLLIPGIPSESCLLTKQRNRFYVPCLTFYPQFRIRVSDLIRFNPTKYNHFDYSHYPMKVYLLHYYIYLDCNDPKKSVN